MAFVLDASVTACWAFEDEEDPLADLALRRVRTEEAVVPGLWWFEWLDGFVPDLALPLLNISRRPNHLQFLAAA